MILWITRMGLLHSQQLTGRTSRSPVPCITLFSPRTSPLFHGSMMFWLNERSLSPRRYLICSLRSDISSGLVHSSIRSPISWRWRLISNSSSKVIQHSRIYFDRRTAVRSQYACRRGVQAPSRLCQVADEISSLRSLTLWRGHAWISMGRCEPTRADMATCNSRSSRSWQVLMSEPAWYFDVLHP